MSKAFTASPHGDIIRQKGGEGMKDWKDLPKMHFDDHEQDGIKAFKPNPAPWWRQWRYTRLFIGPALFFGANRALWHLLYDYEAPIIWIWGVIAVFVIWLVLVIRYILIMRKREKIALGLIDNDNGDKD